MLDCALQQNAHTAHIWFTIPIWCSGTTLSQMWKFLILLKAGSTCIHKLAISCVFTTSSTAIWVDAPRKGGKFKLTPKGNKSFTMNPLSAIMESLSSNGRFKNPLYLTISRSEIKPLYSWLLNVTAPLGEIPSKPFKVVWFLWLYIDKPHPY